MFYKSFLFFAFMQIVMSQAIAQIGVSPSRLFFEGRQGETISQTLTLSNSGTKALEFTLSLKDWKRDSTGAKIYAPAGTFNHSNAKQIKFNESTVSLAPGENKTISIYMEIPQGSADSIATNAMLFVTQASPEPQKTDQTAIGIQVAYEYAIQLFYNPFGVKSGDLEFMEFNYFPQTKNKEKKEGELCVRYKNTGNTNKTATLRLEMTNKQTGEEIKLPPRDLAIMPNDFQVVYFDIPAKMRTGDYLVIAMLDPDNNGQQNRIKIARKNIHIIEY